jgi:2-isopropylmalate synthase
MGPQSETKSDANRVHIFDTTLRDGEQSPGISLNTAEKVEIAQQLARLGVDVIEAGFPITSPGDFEAVQKISRVVEGPVICGLARTHKADIDAAWGAIKEAARPRIHTFISTSDIHIEHQLQTDREDVKGQARAAVALAKSYCEDVEFSPMDATRADIEFTAEVCAIAVEEGATTINIPDTVGYTTPEEYADYFRRLYELVPALREVETSVHCHDDLGLAVANSYAGVLAGARQVECAVNGIGERAGNCSLEEIAMLVGVREDVHGLWTGINTREIVRTSRMVSRLTGYSVQPNKAVVGRNALQQALSELGFELSGHALNTAFKRFKEIADRKKQVTALDLEAIVSDEMRERSDAHELAWFEVEAGSRKPPLAKVAVTRPSGEESVGEASGDGPVDAIFHAIQAAVETECELVEYKVEAVTGGEDALGEVTVQLRAAGRLATGQGVATDILEASARAYVRAISNALEGAATREAEAATAEAVVERTPGP